VIEPAHRPVSGRIVVAALAAALAACGPAGSAGSAGAAATAPTVADDAAGVVPRPLVLDVDGRWIGSGVCYGPHRDGQRPGGPAPTDAELAEDLALMAPRWHLLRIYGADDPAERLLGLIHREHLPFKILLGAWIAPEVGADGGPGAIANRAQIASAIALARAYPDVVAAIVVGNETQVSWSDHRVDLDVLIGHVRAARAGSTVPVTVADDYAFWLGDDAARLVRELDFITLHVHPMWNGQLLDRALPFTQETYAAVVARYPDRTVLLGETGWATRRHTEGDQGTLIKGPADEASQQIFFDRFNAWTVGARIPSTYFEAFDENWKGGAHPDEVEKHWGRFRADRTAKGR